MLEFEQYATRYPSVEMTRIEGILEVRLHTDDGPLVWGHGEPTHYDLAAAYGDIAQDRAIRVVIVTGTGDVHSGPPATRDDYPTTDAESWDAMRENSMRCLANLLSIEAPIISCLNGPVYRHGELALLADIVLAADDACVQDTAHFVHGQVPGDGSHIIYPYLMGPTRASYFMLTGQTLGADELLRLGLVNEVMPRKDLPRRAREIAGQLAEQNPLTLRHTRTLLTQPIRELVVRWLGYGFALEGHAAFLESNLREQQSEPAERMSGRREGGASLL